MAGFPVGGTTGMKPADARALMANLRQNGPPVNPMTPNNRQSVTDERLDAFQKTRKSLELIDRTITPDELVLKGIIDGMRTAIVKLLQGQDPAEVLQGITHSIGAGTVPSVPAAMPAAPTGPTAGPVPPMPPMGGGAPGPVSPGSLPG